MSGERRLRECVERWPECSTGAYDPRCCRFPKSCSAGVYPDGTDESLLEPALDDDYPVLVDIDDDVVYPGRWEPMGLPEPTPLPDGPFVWVLTLGPDASHESTAASYEALYAALPDAVRARSRVILLAPGYALQSFDDEQLRNLGLQRIEGAA